MLKFKLKAIKGNTFKIEKIIEINDYSTEDKTVCKVDDREYKVGSEIKEENLYRLKQPGIMLIYI